VASDACPVTLFEAMQHDGSVVHVRPKMWRALAKGETRPAGEDVDMSCAARRPLLCLSPHGLERPDNTRPVRMSSRPQPDGRVFESAGIDAWTGAQIAVTAPLVGSSLHNAMDADQACRGFGTTFRAARTGDDQAARMFRKDDHITMHGPEMGFAGMEAGLVPEGPLLWTVKDSRPPTDLMVAPSASMNVFPPKSAGVGLH
jgi:hypothetical protein